MVGRIYKENIATESLYSCEHKRKLNFLLFSQMKGRYSLLNTKETGYHSWLLHVLSTLLLVIIILKSLCASKYIIIKGRVTHSLLVPPWKYWDRSWKRFKMREKMKIIWRKIWGVNKRERLRSYS